MGVMRVGKLIEELSNYEPDLPVFVRLWCDSGYREDVLKSEPLYAENLVVEHVDYDTPHVGGYYGRALILGEFDDE